MAGPEDLHEWVSFDDPHDDRTWVFDASFLRSTWRCIYGAGCLGVLPDPAPELAQGCCSFGAHAVDADDRAAVDAAAARLTPEQWQRHAQGRRRGTWTVEEGGALVTRVVDGACIFLNRPDFARGPGCALHVGALDAGERPMDWKPDVCWQVPLRLQEHTDDHGHVTSLVREWKRRDWGEGGADFHWWCTASPEAFAPGGPAVVVSLRDELVELVGAEVYGLLLQALRLRRTPLPHPAVRR